MARCVDSGSGGGGISVGGGVTTMTVAWLLVLTVHWVLAQPPSRPSFTPADLEKALAKIDEGYDTRKPSPKGVARYVLKHRSQTIHVEHLSTADQALVRLWAVVRDKATLESLNAWNRDHYFGKAYLNRDDEVIFEACLPVSRGLTEELFADWFEVYTHDLIAFKQFLRQ